MTSRLFACSGSHTCVDHVLPSSSEGLHAVACRLGLHQDAPGPISGAPRCLPTPARSQTAALVHPKVPRDQGPAAPPRQSHRPLQTVSAQTLTDGATLPPSQAQTRRRESGHLMPSCCWRSGPPQQVASASGSGRTRALIFGAGRRLRALGHPVALSYRRLPPATIEIQSQLKHLRSMPIRLALGLGVRDGLVGSCEPSPLVMGGFGSTVRE